MAPEATTICEHPIIFSGEMIRAILDGRKTQTRRVIKPQPVDYPPFYLIETTSGHGMFAASGKHRGCGMGQWDSDEAIFELYDAFAKLGGRACQRGGRTRWRCPYGKTGDRLWVRETWGHISWHEVGQHVFNDGPKPDRTEVVYRAGPHTFNADVPHGWSERDRWRSPIYMPRCASRILLEITAARVERVQDINIKAARREGCHSTNPVCEFQELWHSLNAKRGFGWDTNPWVWVIEYKKLTPDC